MIKINKSTPAPEVRNRQGVNQLAQLTIDLIAAYNDNSASYDDGTLDFEFEPKVYGHSKVKRRLIKDQNGKCGFCESNILSISSGDVEHFRPKGGYHQNKNDEKLSKPGYYWLAYEWNNFILSCERCNRIHKKNYFPLLRSENRCKNHNHHISQERSYFVNPLTENPKNLIGFREYIAYGKDRRNRGKTTIKYLGLNRSGDGFMDLIEIRQDFYERTKPIYNLSKKMAVAGIIEQAEINEAIALMKKFRSEKYQFSSMIQDNFPE